jgi:hypothetical protein
MNLRREVIAAFAALIVILLLTSLGAVGLFARMSPAIEKIIQENGYSLEACERMLAVLAEASASSDPVPEDLRTRSARFDAALAAARNNVTEPEETPLIELIESAAPRALSGDAAALSTTVEAVRSLADINRNAMKRVDREARRLGTAGAWSAVFLGLLGFAIALYVVERLLQKIVKPLAELQSVLASAMSGDRTRRCTPGTAAPDIEFVKSSFNTLLDQGVRSDAPAGREILHCRAARTVLVHLLDQIEEARAVVDTSGTVIAANGPAVALLRGSTGERVKERLTKAAGDDNEAPEWVVARFPDAHCVLSKLA